MNGGAMNGLVHGGVMNGLMDGHAAHSDMLSGAMSGRSMNSRVPLVNCGVVNGRVMDGHAMSGAASGGRPHFSEFGAAPFVGTASEVRGLGLVAPRPFTFCDRRVYRARQPLLRI